MSEVRDWAAGGRTGAAHLHRIFDRELAAGPTKVCVLLRSGTKGVAFCKALDRCAQYPELPKYADPRRQTCIWGEVHASALALLRAEFAAELRDETVEEVAAREEAEAKRRALEAKRQVRDTVTRRTVCRTALNSWHDLSTEVAHAHGARQRACIAHRYCILQVHQWRLHHVIC